MKIAKPRNFSDIIIGLSSAKMLSSNLRIIFAIIQGCAIIHFYSRCLETICWYKTPTSTSGRVLPPANCWLTNWCIYLSRDYKMFVKIWVLIESRDSVLRTWARRCGAGGKHLHPDFSLSVSAARRWSARGEVAGLATAKPFNQTAIQETFRPPQQFLNANTIQWRI